MACECTAQRMIYDADGRLVTKWNNFATPITLSTSARAQWKHLCTKIEIPCMLDLAGGSARITKAVIFEKAALSSDLKKKGISLVFLADDGYTPAEGDAWDIATSGMLTSGGNEYCGQIDFVTADYTTIDKAAIARKESSNLLRVYNSKTTGLTKSVYMYVVVNESAGITFVSGESLYIALEFEPD